MVYFQCDENRLFHHFDVACAYYGLKDSDTEKYKLITFDELKDITHLQVKNSLFVGSVKFMREVFLKINKSPRHPLYSNRPYEEITIKEVIERVLKGEEFFIKPKEIKNFTGFVVNKYDINTLNSYDENLVVLKFEKFNSNIISEYRCYVLNGKLMDCRCYSGEFDKLPDFKVAEVNAKENLRSFPIAYTIDICLLEDGSTEIVEYNDMWAIGNYGMENNWYLRMLRERYFEIIKSN